jgi:hypothetical protein
MTVPTIATQPDNTSLFIDGPHTAERLESLFKELKAEVIRPPKPNWVYELGDFDDYEYPDMQWVQPGMIAEGCVTVIVAPTGHGKSFLGLKLAQTCTSPGELFGHLHQERAVLYLDRENKVRSLKERAKLLGVKIYGKANPDSKLYYSSVFLDGPREPEDKHILEWAKQQSPPPVIIVDTLLRHLKKGMKENSSDDIAAWFALFTKLLQIGCSVLVLHHTGKGETTKNGRGSLDIEGVSDFYFKLTNVTPGKNGKPDSSRPIEVVKIERIKGRIQHELWDDPVFVHIGEKWDFTIGEKPTKRKESETTTSEETADTGDAEKLRAIVEGNPGVTGQRFEELAKEHGIGQRAARIWMKAGVSDGSIVKRLGLNNSRLHYLSGMAPSEQAVCSEGLLPVASEGG